MLTHFAYEGINLIKKNYNSKEQKYYILPVPQLDVGQTHRPLWAHFDTADVGRSGIAGVEHCYIAPVEHSGTVKRIDKNLWLLLIHNIEINANWW